MAGVHTAGVARITIRPDLNGFKQEVEKVVRRIVAEERDLHFDAKLDDTKARSDAKRLEDDLRRELGDSAKNVPVGVDEKSSRRAVRQLLAIGDKGKDNKKNLEDFHKRLEGLTSAFQRQGRTIDDTYKNVRKQIEQTSAAQSKAAKQAAKDWEDQAKRVDRRREDEFGGDVTVERAEAALYRAQRAEAKLGDKAEPTLLKQTRDARILAERGVTEAHQKREQLRLDRQRAEEQLKVFEKGFREQIARPVTVGPARQKAIDSMERLSDSSRGKFNNVRSAAAALIRKELEASENPGAARGIGKELFQAAKNFDRYKTSRDTAARMRQAAVNNAAIVKMRHERDIVDYAGDPIRVAQANERLRRAQEGVEVTTSTLESADVDLSMAEKHLREAEKRFVDRARGVERDETGHVIPAAAGKGDSKNFRFPDSQSPFEQVISKNPKLAGGPDWSDFDHAALWHQQYEEAAEKVAKEESGKSVDNDVLASIRESANRHVEEVQREYAQGVAESGKAGEANRIVRNKFNRSNVADINPDGNRRIAMEMIRAGQDWDKAIERNRSSLASLNSAIRESQIAEAKYAQLKQDGAEDSIELAEADARRAAATERVRDATRRQYNAEVSERVARSRFDTTRKKVDKARAFNPIVATTDFVERNVSKAWANSGQRLLRMAQYLSAVGRLAIAGGVALGGMAAVNIAPLLGSIGVMANTLALVPALAVAAGAALAAMVVGAGGITDAFKAASKMSDNKPTDKDIKAANKAAVDAEYDYERAVESVGDAYERREDAIRDLQDAEKDARRTAIDGAREIRDAEEQVVDAKQAAKDAERDLARARKDAARDVRDLNDALKEGSLSEEESILSVQRAQERLRETRRDPKASRLDRKEAELGVRRARINLEQTRKRNAGLREDAAKTNAVGIEGSDGVVDAKRNVVDAREGVRDAQQNLRDTRTDVADANEQAARRVETAHRSIRDADRGIRDANKAVADAADNMAEANEKLSLALAGLDASSLEEFERAMGKLSPSARSFVETARGLGDAWSSLRESVQENLFDGMDASLLRLTGQMPILQQGLSGISTMLNFGVRSAVQSLSSESAKLDFSKTLGNTTEATGVLARSAAPLAAIWIDLATVGSEYLPRLASAVEGAISRFAGRLDLRRESGELNEFFDRGIEKVKQWGQVLGNTFSGIKNLFSAASPLGDSMTENLVRITERFQKWSESEDGRKSILDFFTSTKSLLHETWENVKLIAGVFTDHLIPAFQTFSDLAGPVLRGLLEIVKALGPALEWLLVSFLALRVVGGVVGGIQTRMLNLWGAVDRTRTAGAGIGGFFRDGLTGARNEIDRTVDKQNELGRGSEDNARRSKNAFRGLATGFASLGITALLGAVTIALGAMADAHAKAAEEAAKQEAALQALGDTLDERAGIATGRTREEFGNRLSKEDEHGTSMFDRAASFGLTNNDIVEAGMGNAEAKARADDRLAEAAEASLKASQRYAENKAAFNQVGLTSDVIARALLNDAEALEQFRRGRDELLEMEKFERKGQISNVWDLTELKADLDDAGDSAVELGIAYNRFNVDVVEQGEKVVERNEALEGIFLQTTEAEKAVQALGFAISDVRKDQFVIDGKMTPEARKALEALGYTADQGGDPNTHILTSRGTRADGEAPVPLTYKQGTTDPTFNPKAAVPPPPPTLDEDGVPLPPPEVDPNAEAEIEINPDALVYEDVELPPAEVDLPELEFADDGSLLGAVTQVPQVDYAPALGAFKTYGEHIAEIFQDKIEPALMRMIELQGQIGPSMRESTDVSIPAMDELGEATGRLGESFKVHITEGALVEWDKLLPGIGTDIFKIQNEQFPMLMKALKDMQESFRLGAKGIGEEFTKIVKGVGDPVNWVIREILNKGLKNAWNAVREVIPSLKEWTVTATEVTIPGFHTGGIMSGYNPGRDDRVIAVGGGEAIMRPEWTRAVGPDYVNEMNAAARQGGITGVRALTSKYAGAFNQGGIVGAMTDAVKEKFPMMSMTSGLRFTDDGYHSKGMAADFSNTGAGMPSTPAMRSLAGWIADNFPPRKTLQLIHQPFNRNIGQGVGWVGDGLGFYGAGTMGQHQDHVHWATDRLVSADGTSAPGPVGLDGGAYASAVSAKVRKMFFDPVDKILSKAPKFGSTLFGGSLPSTFLDQLVESAKRAVGTLADSNDAGNTPWDISAGVEQWDANIRAALAREGWEVNERNVQLTKAQMQTESGGDPNIIQQVQDVNSGGNEAVGLMQVTPGTFAAYRNLSLPNDRTNPDASLSAALRWYRYKWGDDLGTMWGKGHGYDEGGWLEDGTTGHNSSGKPEPVFTHNQWGMLKDLIDSLREMAPALDLDFGIPVQIIDFGRKAIDTLTEMLTGTPLVTKSADAAGSVPADATEMGTSGQEDPVTPTPVEDEPELDGAERDSALAAAIATRDEARAELEAAETGLHEATATLNAAMQTGELNAEQLALAKAELDTAKDRVREAQDVLERAELDVEAITRGKKPQGRASADTEPGVQIDPSIYGGDKYTPPVGTSATGHVAQAPADGDSYGSDDSVDPDLLAEADSYFAEGGDYRDGDEGVAAGSSILEGYPQRIADAGLNFLKANYDQFKSDLGISGQGALPNLIREGSKLVQEYGPQVIEQIHYHVVDIDEAMRKERVRQAQNAKTYYRR